MVARGQTHRSAQHMGQVRPPSTERPGPGTLIHSQNSKRFYSGEKLPQILICHMGVEPGARIMPASAPQGSMDTIPWVRKSLASFGRSP